MVRAPVRHVGAFSRSPRLVQCHLEFVNCSTTHPGLNFDVRPLSGFHVSVSQNALNIHVSHAERM